MGHAVSCKIQQLFRDNQPRAVYNAETSRDRAEQEINAYNVRGPWRYSFCVSRHGTVYTQDGLNGADKSLQMSAHLLLDFHLLHMWPDNTNLHSRVPGS